MGAPAIGCSMQSRTPSIYAQSFQRITLSDLSIRSERMHTKNQNPIRALASVHSLFVKLIYQPL